MWLVLIACWRSSCGRSAARPAVGIRDYGLGFLTSTTWDVGPPAVRHPAAHLGHALQLGARAWSSARSSASRSRSSSPRTSCRRQLAPRVQAPGRAARGHSERRVRAVGHFRRDPGAPAARGLALRPARAGFRSSARTLSGPGMLPASLVLAIMVLPTVSALSRTRCVAVPYQAQGGGVRPGRDHAGRRSSRSCCRPRPPASSARSCSASAARSARRWPWRCCRQLQPRSACRCSPRPTRWRRCWR